MTSCLEKVLRKSGIFSSKWVRVGITDIVVSLLWVFFRADSIGTVGAVLKGMFTVHTGIFQPYTWILFAVIVLATATMLARHHAKDKEAVSGYYPILDLSKTL